MRYFFALTIPPLAVAASAGPITFLLNILLCLLFLVPGIIHAFLVVNRFYADRRHAQLMKAMNPKATVPQPANALGVFAALMTAGVVFIGYQVHKSWQRVVEVKAAKAQPAMPIAQPGQSFEAISQQFGQPAHKDPASGIATWETFDAVFKDGIALEVRRTD